MKGFAANAQGITIFVRTGGLEFTVSKRLDCGIAMLHLEVAALNSGIPGTWSLLKSPEVGRFNLVN